MELLRFRQKPTDKINKAIQEAVDEMAKEKQNATKTDVDWGNGILVTELRPDDLGLGGVPSTTLGDWILNVNGAAATGWKANVINRTLNEYTIVVLTGFRKGIGSTITEVQFKLDGQDTAVINLTMLDQWEEREGYFSQPVKILYEKDVVMATRTRLGVAGSTTDPFQVLGYAVKLATTARLQVVNS